MSTPLSEDHELVVGLSPTAAIARLQDEGMGPMEAVEFLIEAAAQQVLGLSPSGEFFAAAPSGNMTHLLQEAVSAAWESGGLSDEQHDLALTYLNRGEQLASGD